MRFTYLIYDVLLFPVRYFLYYHTTKLLVRFARARGWAHAAKLTEKELKLNQKKSELKLEMQQRKQKLQEN